MSVVQDIKPARALANKSSFIAEPNGSSARKRKSVELPARVYKEVSDKHSLIVTEDVKKRWEVLPSAKLLAATTEFVDMEAGMPVVWEWCDERPYARAPSVTVENVRLDDLTDPWMYTAVQCSSEWSISAHTGAPQGVDWAGDVTSGSLLTLQYADEAACMRVAMSCLQFVRTPGRTLVVKVRRRKAFTAKGMPLREKRTVSKKSVGKPGDYPPAMRSVVIRNIPATLSDVDELLASIHVTSDKVASHEFRVNARGIPCCVVTFADARDCVAFHARHTPVVFAGVEGVTNVYLMAAGIDYCTLLHSSEPCATDDDSWVTAYGKHMRTTEYMVQPVNRKPRHVAYNEFRETYGDKASRKGDAEDTMTTERDGAIVTVHRLDTRQVHRRIVDARMKFADNLRLKEKRKKREAERKQAQLKKKKVVDEDLLEPMEIPVIDLEEEVDRRIKKEVVPAAAKIAPTKKTKTLDRRPARTMPKKITSARTSTRAQHHEAPARHHQSLRMDRSPVERRRRRRSATPPPRAHKRVARRSDYDHPRTDYSNRRVDNEETLSYENEAAMYGGGDGGFMMVQQQLLNQRDQLFGELERRQMGLTTNTPTINSAVPMSSIYGGAQLGLASTQYGGTTGTQYGGTAGTQYGGTANTQYAPPQNPTMYAEQPVQAAVMQGGTSYLPSTFVSSPFMPTAPPAFSATGGTDASLFKLLDSVRGQQQGTAQSTAMPPAYNANTRWL